MVRGSETAFWRGTFTSISSGFDSFHSACNDLPCPSFTATSLTQQASEDSKCNVSSRPTISALASLEATINRPAGGERKREGGPSKERNPQVPRRTPVTSPARAAPYRG